MAVTVIGVSLQPEVLETLDRMTAAEGVARSAMIGRLIEDEDARRRAKRESPLEVVVGGVRYVPQRRRAAG
jgi:metal-responsive CopG/Arc/MetJ family transcriptional regulator